jgi:hypothetical protein
VESEGPRHLTPKEEEEMRSKGRKTKDWRPRLTELQGGNRIRQFHKLVDRSKFTVDKIMTGGGGNPGIECLAMCQKLLEGFQAAGEASFEWAQEELRK